MHLADGILNPPVWIGGYAVAAGTTCMVAKSIASDEIPKIAVMTSTFFVASLLHLPVGPSSVHLLLNGLVGILLGRAAFISILVGVILQTLLFQHGGITVIGVNTLVLGIPAVAIGSVFRLMASKVKRKAIPVMGGILCGLSILMSLLLLVLCLITDVNFQGSANLLVLACLPLVLIEGLFAFGVVSFLMKIKPDLILKGGS